MGIRDLSVHEHQWGDDTWASPLVEQGLSLVSLKALALTDQAIREGFTSIQGPLLIARFLGGHESAQAEFLGLPSSQSEVTLDAESPAGWPCPMSISAARISSSSRITPGARDRLFHVEHPLVGGPVFHVEHPRRNHRIIH